MNTITTILIVAPVTLIVFWAGGVAARARAWHLTNTINGLTAELDELHDMYRDVVDEWVEAATVVDQINRRLGNCMCGNRLSPQQEAVVFSVLSNASIIDDPEEDTDGE